MTAPTTPDSSESAADPDVDNVDEPVAAPPAPTTTGGASTKPGSRAKRPQLAPLKLGPLILAGALLVAIVVVVIYRLLGPLWGSVVLAGLALLTALGVWLWRRRAARRGGGRGSGKGRGGKDGGGRGGPLARLRSLLPGGGRRGQSGAGAGAGGGKKGGPLARLRKALGGGKDGGGPLGALRRALGRGPGRNSGGGPGGGRASKGKNPGGGRSRNGGGGSGRDRAPWWWPFGGGSSNKKKGKNKPKGTTTETGPCGGPGPDDGKNKSKDKPKDAGKPDGGPAGKGTGSGSPRPTRPSRPVRTQTGGFMGARLDEAGLLRFGQSLKEDPDKIAQVRDFYRQKAEAADENPINQGVTDSLHAIANLFGRAAEIAADLHGQYTSGNEADIHRNQNPRRGEEKADHSYNKRDQ